MATWYIYKTKTDTIFAVGLSTDHEGIIRITCFDHNIPPSRAKLIDTFQANSLHDYIEKIVPSLFNNLKEDKEITKLYNRIHKE